MAQQNKAEDRTSPNLAPPNSIRTVAIALLFKDGFSIEDLVEIFSLSTGNVEEHVRRAMFNGHKELQPDTKKIVPVGIQIPASTKRKAKTATVVAGTDLCARHPGAKSTRKGECRKCRQIQWQKNYADKKKANASAPARSVGAAAVDESPNVIGSSENESVFARIAEKANKELQPASTEVEKLFSHELQCPKCYDRHRFWKRADAQSEKDYWISLGCNNNLKIANYQIKVDKTYRSPEVR